MRGSSEDESVHLHIDQIRVHIKIIRIYKAKISYLESTLSNENSFYKRLLFLGFLSFTTVFFVNLRKKLKNTATEKQI